MDGAIGNFSGQSFMVLFDSILTVVLPRSSHVEGSCRQRQLRCRPSCHCELFRGELHCRFYALAQQGCTCYQAFAQAMVVHMYATLNNTFSVDTSYVVLPFIL